MLIRVAVPGVPAFRLRKGEEGLSLFDAVAVDPPLTESEVLDEFRPGSIVVVRFRDQIEQVGLQVVPVEGAASLTERLRKAHVEIQPGDGMTRGQFKRALEELEHGPQES